MSDVTLYCGECAEVMAREIADASIDLTVTSPPYDNLRAYKGFTFDFEAIAAQLWRVTKPGGVVVWVVGDATINGSETGTSFRQALYFMGLGFNLHDTMIYEKSGTAYPDSNRYWQTWEFMFVFAKDKPQTANLLRDRPNEYVGTMGGNGRGGLCRREEYGLRFNVWRYATGRDNSTSDRDAYDHPAVFPEALARDHIASWSNPGDVVLDPMMGSGTTGKMAVRAGRRFIGIDIAAEYVALARERIGRTQLQPALFTHDAPRAVQSAMFDGGD
jgi:DNA modification methylase